MELEELEMISNKVKFGIVCTLQIYTPHFYVI